MIKPPVDRRELLQNLGMVFGMAANSRFAPNTHSGIEERVNSPESSYKRAQNVQNPNPQVTYSLSDVYRLFENAGVRHIDLAGTTYSLVVEYITSIPAVIGHEPKILFFYGTKWNDDHGNLRSLAPNDPKLVAHNGRRGYDNILGKIEGETIGDNESDYLVIDGKVQIGAAISDRYKEVSSEVINDIGRALAQVVKPK